MSYEDPRSSNPQFPGRPDHVDFVVLSDIAQGLDVRAEAGVPIPALVNVDEDSLMYFVLHRLGRQQEAAAQQLGVQVPNHLMPFMMALYIDAITIGMRFQEMKTK